MEKKSFFKEHEEIIIYLIVGVLTTIFSWFACFLAKFFLDSNDGIQNFLINTVGWVAGVLFAYPLNRKWVFKSSNPAILKEFSGFVVSRISTWVLDVVIMWFFVNVWTLERIISIVAEKFGYPLAEASLGTVNYWFVKICISSVLVTILNYVFSKLLIFRKDN